MYVYHSEGEIFGFFTTHDDALRHASANDRWNIRVFIVAVVQPLPTAQPASRSNSPDAEFLALGQ